MQRLFALGAAMVMAVGCADGNAGRSGAVAPSAAVPASRATPCHNFPAAPPASSPATLMPHAGSAGYLVYTQLRPTGYGFNSGGLFVLSRGSAVPRRLATVNDETDGGYSIAGSMLIYVSYEQVCSDTAQTVVYTTNWFNLATGASGRVKNGSTTTIAAAPDGWITLNRKDGTLADQPTEGPARSLGRPVPQSTVPFVAVGDQELVVSSVFSDDPDGNGELRVMSFADPGAFRTLIPSLKDATEEDYSCLSVTAQYVACETEGGRIRLIPLDGGPVVKTTRGCPAFDVQVMNDSAAWRGCHGRFTTLTLDGSVHVSGHRYAPGMVPAFGELAVASRFGDAIELVSSATGTPKVLVQT